MSYESTAATPLPASAVVHLSVNLAPDVAEAFRRECAIHGVSESEGVRRAISIWVWFEKQTREGKRPAIIDRRRNGEQLWEVQLPD